MPKANQSVPSTGIPKNQPVHTETAWLERYSRQILLKEIGGQGQNRLGQSVVGIVGAGSIGTPLILYLAAAGVGHVIIVDDNRMAHKKQSGERASLARAAAHAINPTIKTTAIHTTWHPDDTDTTGQMASWDLTVLANNCPDTRKTVKAATRRMTPPLLGHWRIGNTHYITASHADSVPNAPCLFCSEPADTHPISIRPPPIRPPSQLSHMASGVVGSILAMETLKILLGIGQGLWYTLLAFDPEKGTYKNNPTHKNPLCPVCKDHRND